ncbi:MAG: N-acetylmuramoyl-L-alanine amidase [Bacteroidales bacterium]|nr:N-acetylmuramoyl-L-alanine amidase [Bacteroidales bacterium]
MLFTACAVMLLAASCLTALAQKSGNATAVRLRTLVIDAGHGGKDPGCISRDNKTYEKNLVLDIATQFGALVEEEFPEVNVIYTRKTDVFLTLGERSDMANKANADLFVSIHVNAQEKGSSARGYSSHIFGRSQTKSDLMAMNMEMVKRENSVILLEDDYSTTYQNFDPNDTESYIFFNLMQNAFYEQSISFADAFVKQMGRGKVFSSSRGISQDPYFVLWKTSMPSVLVECGFMTNPSDLSVLRTKEGIRGTAEALFEAFCDFKASYEGSTRIVPDRKTEHADTTVQAGTGAVRESEASQPSDSTETAAAAENGAKAPMYGCQIFISGRVIKAGERELKGWTAEMYRKGNIYKYVVALTPDKTEARKKFQEVRKDFPDAFLVVVEDDVVEILK